LGFKKSLLLISLLVFSACKDIERVVPGHYEGAWTTQQGRASVAADVKLISDSRLLIDVQNPLESQSFKINVDLTYDGFDLRSQGALSLNPTHFKEGGHNCFTSSIEDQVCFQGSKKNLSISLKLKQVHTQIELHKMAAVPTPALETPDSYTVDQLVARAKTQNIDNLVKFQRVLQAKSASSTAFLNLLPHLNINSALNAVQISLYPTQTNMTLARMVGDIAPFLLPSRWFHAASLKNQTEAEADGYRLVQASSMNIAQSLALSVLRDEHIIQTLEENEIKIIQARDSILAQIQGGGGDLQIGVSDALDISLNQIKSSVLNLKQNLKSEKIALAQAVGLINPEGIEEVLPLAELPRVKVIEGTQTSWRELALGRSIELGQLDHLLKAAKNMTRERYFQWLDPLGDNQGSLGAGLVSYPKFGKAKVKEIVDLRKQSEQKILAMLQDALNLSQTLQLDYQNAVDTSLKSQAQILRLTFNFDQGNTYSTLELATAFQSKAMADVNQIADQYAALILKAKLDYLTFSGTYSDLLEHQEF